MRRRALLAASTAQGGESEWAFSFNIEVAYGEDWIANPEQLVQINKILAIVTRFFGLGGGDFSEVNAPPEFDLRINGERNFSFYYPRIKNESAEVDLAISFRSGVGIWIASYSFPWNNPVVDSFKLWYAI